MAPFWFTKDVGGRGEGVIKILKEERATLAEGQKRVSMVDLSIAENVNNCLQTPTVEEFGAFVEGIWNFQSDGGPRGQSLGTMHPG